MQIHTSFLRNFCHVYWITLGQVYIIFYVYCKIFLWYCSDSFASKIGFATIFHSICQFYLFFLREYKITPNYFLSDYKLNVSTVEHLQLLTFLFWTGYKWKTHRKLIQPCFHINVLETYINTFWKNANILVDTLPIACDLNITSYINNTVLDILYRE